ncbi:hypothetical protein H106_03085 [Trichophyton rubrum CBS 735.88]|nr:hypothetical protein H106_03085 [Trichophyton rubrum CBS 735.88]
MGNCMFVKKVRLVPMGEILAVRDLAGERCEALRNAASQEGLGRDEIRCYWQHVKDLLNSLLCAERRRDQDDHSSFGSPGLVPLVGLNHLPMHQFVYLRSKQRPQRQYNSLLKMALLNN